MAIYRTDDLISLVVSLEFATELMAQVKRPGGLRAVYSLRIGPDEMTRWQVEAVATVQRDAGYDDIMATFRRVLE